MITEDHVNKELGWGFFVVSGALSVLNVCSIRAKYVHRKRSVDGRVDLPSQGKFAGQDTNKTVIPKVYFQLTVSQFI